MAQDCPHCSLCLIPAVEGLQHNPSVQSFWNSRSSACWRETQQELEIFDPSNGVALLAIVWDMVHGAWGVRAARPGVLSPGSHEDTAGRAGMLLQPVSLSCRGKGQPSPGGCSWGATSPPASCREAPSSTSPCRSCLSALTGTCCGFCVPGGAGTGLAMGTGVCCDSWAVLPSCCLHNL